MKRFLVVRSGLFERHGWVMKEATIFSWEDVPTRTRVGVVPWYMGTKSGCTV
jgi:hypothetical protein